MGGHKSKEPEMIYVSDPCTTPRDACSSLESKLTAEYGNSVVTMMESDPENSSRSLFSPRGTLDITALASVRGQSYRVTLIETRRTADPDLRQRVIASVSVH